MYLGADMGLLDFFSKPAKQTRQKSKLIHPEFSYLFEHLPDEWVCLDLEMTGLNPKTDHILSVGAIKITQKHGVLSIDTANSLSLICRPPVMPTTDSIIIHGLRPVDVENGLDYEKMLNVLLPFIGGRTVVGFCTEMDVGFLNTLIKPYLGVALPNDRLDVSIMEQKIRQRQNKNPEIPIEKKHLNTLLNEYRIPRLPSHNALNDAMMTAMLFCHLARLNRDMV